VRPVAYLTGQRCTCRDQRPVQQLASAGDTEDSGLADLAVGWGAEQIKVGSLTRSEPWNWPIQACRVR
jgi:hypothetical protein